MTKQQTECLIQACIAAGISTDGAVEYMKSCLNAGKMLYGAPDIVPVLPKISRFVPEYAKEKNRIISVMEKMFFLFVLVPAIDEAKNGE